MKFEPPNGAYCVPVYPCREMEFPYRADTNQVFMTEIPYEDYEDADAKTPLIKNGWCMVIRSRAKLDAEGKIVGAHYSVIMGKCTLDKEFEYIKALFNPEAEDTNLEWDDPVRRQFIEEQKRGHR